jgi:uncharacterized membrane protein (UPF0127 family)
VTRIREPLRPALALLLLLAIGCEAVGEEPTAPGAWVTIRNTPVAAEVVVSAADQARGLGYRDSLEWNHGMLFPYESPGFRSFWMKGMRFDIDIVWILDGRIVGIHHRVPRVEAQEGPWPPVGTDSMVDQVLEVPAGFAAAHGWRTGDRVTVERTGLPEAA